MNSFMENDFLVIINQIFKAVFDEENKASLDEILDKFAFDLKLPKKVYDSTTGEETYSDSYKHESFITVSNMDKRDYNDGWMLEKVDVNSLEEIIQIWKRINYTTTERVYDSQNVLKSDTIYRSENVYQSTNCSECKNIVYCDSCHNSEFILASQRSTSISFCIRTDDSVDCSNSYNVICSNKISNSFFIQDCSNLHECMFCSHIANKKYCISNMQFTYSEYFSIKKAIVEWILSS